jgi:hypothetical protein
MALIKLSPVFGSAAQVIDWLVVMFYVLRVG